MRPRYFGLLLFGGAAPTDHINSSVVAPFAKPGMVFSYNISSAHPRDLSLFGCWERHLVVSKIVGKGPRTFDSDVGPQHGLDIGSDIPLATEPPFTTRATDNVLRVPGKQT